MEGLIDLQALKDTLEAARQWLTDNVMVFGNLGQAAVILVVFFLARVGRARLLGLLKTQTKWPTFKARYQAIEERVDPFVLPVLWLILQWLAEVIAAGAGWSHHLITITASLLTAWIVIRLTSSLVRDPVLSRFIAVFAWTIAALNIVGLLDPTIQILDGLSITLGSLRVSMLTVIKGILSLTILLWLATVSARLLEKRIKAMPLLTPSVQVLFSKFIRISLIVIAILVALSSVGIDLTAFAVFGGAVGVGIGFGLQKVVSNLISGLLLLMDKSVKPGDVIAIGETYGTIESLGARYVSVKTRDGTEHLIPNEELITQRVENWSHTNRLIRLKIPVGIAYSSDLVLARELCLEAARETGRVLRTPPPVCHLIGFGDSSVDLELRVWIDDPQSGVVNVKSDILLGIWERFRDKGIEIPFPQRDVTISAPNPIPVMLREPKA
jgi:small-conductance mechanosensitive channel